MTFRVVSFLVLILFISGCSVKSDLTTYNFKDVSSKNFQNDLRVNNVVAKRVVVENNGNDVYVKYIAFDVYNGSDDNIFVDTSKSAIGYNSMIYDVSFLDSPSDTYIPESLKDSNLEYIGNIEKSRYFIIPSKSGRKIYIRIDNIMKFDLSNQAFLDMYLTYEIKNSINRVFESKYQLIYNK